VSNELFRLFSREEGSNGDREMASAIYAAGMDPWDIHMSDLLNGEVDLDDFQGNAHFMPLFSNPRVNSCG
jgi:phosphoribosylformylglycinamidine (FGAM) synthase-like amidotransferase family enzyme